MELMDHFNLLPGEQQAVQALRNVQNWFQRATLGGIAIVLAPLAEEILFRGIVYPAVKQFGFPRLALVGHVAAVRPDALEPAHLRAAGCAGAGADALLYERTNNLLAPIIAHGLFNALNFVRSISATSGVTQ